MTLLTTKRLRLRRLITWVITTFAPRQPELVALLRPLVEQT